MTDKNHKKLLQRSTIVSITSVVVFLSGLVWTASVPIFGSAMYLHPSPSFFFATIFFLVVGPLFILCGYNLWKMEKWAAQLPAIILLLDLISAPFLGVGFDIGRVLGAMADTVILVLIAFSLKHLR